MNTKPDYIVTFTDSAGNRFPVEIAVAATRRKAIETAEYIRDLGGWDEEPILPWQPDPEVQGE